MSQTLTFTKVFKAEGEKNGKPWTRWDYKTQGGDRFVHFADDQQIELNTPVTVEHNDGAIKSFKAATNTQESDGSSNGSQAVTAAPTASQDDAVGRTKAIYAAQMGPALFNSLDSDEQTIENAIRIMDRLVQYAFANTIAF